MPPDGEALLPDDPVIAGFADAKRQVSSQFSGWLPKPQPAGQTRPFRALGHDRGRFFFWTADGRQVIALKARDLHSAAELPQLAPLQWWEQEYPGRQGFDTKAAGDSLIRACYAAGVYDPDALRGRGVWIDAGRTVVHLGNRLIVDGSDTELASFQTNFIYEQAKPLHIGIAEAMGDEEARKLLRLCCEVAWENPDRDGRLLAGWMVTALLCGSMAWRPHLWLVSEAGGGKSWVLDNIVKPVLRSLALMVQGKTSEAGIRGELGSDARPVIFDEAETQNEADRSRVQGVLDLARQSSTEDGGTITKGTKDGGSRRYLIRSSFILASVNLGLSQAADESRFVPLSIGSGSPTQFAMLKALHAETFTEGFSARLLARCIRLLPTIRANAETLADAISRTGAGRRAGDTLGTMLAGALSLSSERRLTPAEAERILSEHEWVRRAAEEAKPMAEWRRALDRLCQHIKRYTNQNGRPEEMTVAELVLGAIGRGVMSSSDAASTIARMGLRVEHIDDGPHVILANQHKELEAVFTGTPWAAAWKSTIARAPGAHPTAKLWKFAGHTSRALAIPLSRFLGEEDRPDGRIG